MRSGWIESEAQDTIARYSNQEIAPDLAIRIYSARLLGREPHLVLHGGGNISVKTIMFDLFGEEVEVICIKSSGADLATIEPPQLPAVRLDLMRKLRARNAVADDDLLSFQRRALLDQSAPNPSVELLLHAFLPHKFVDHTHANAILSLVDQPDGKAICEELYDGRVCNIPYVRPGFALAKTAADAFEKRRDVEGLILHKHGIFTFAETARESYERMIALVTLAEERLKRNRKPVFATALLPQPIASHKVVAPILRGACSLKDENIEGAWRRPILDFRTGPAILNFVNGAELERYGQAGVVTPDHVIRIKRWPLIVPAPQESNLGGFREAARRAAAAFMQTYESYFSRHHVCSSAASKMLDSRPRVALVPGLGLFGLADSKKQARIAADLAVAAVTTITDAEAIGRYESISEAETFDMEYWPLELAKLGPQTTLPLAGQIAAITGGAGTIGATTARTLAAAGAAVALLDIDEKAANEVAKSIDGAGVAIHCDVTDLASVATAFDQVVEEFGGLDVLVSNAGAAWQGRIGEVDEDVLRKSFEINFYGHQRAAQAAVRIMRAQDTGGCLLFNVSKQAVSPGPDFGPYGLPKAATLFLVRQYALDYGRDGIRANAVNADRIRSGLLTNELIAERSRARGLSEKDYLSGNLLAREVTAEDVAQAFLHQILELKTTGNVTTVDGGNIAAALR